MADVILIRAGNEANMPKLADRELAYARDKNSFYVGTPGGNKKVSSTEALTNAEIEALLNSNA